MRTKYNCVFFSFFGMVKNVGIANYSMCERDPDILLEVNILTDRLHCKQTNVTVSSDSGFKLL